MLKAFFVVAEIVIARIHTPHLEELTRQVKKYASRAWAITPSLDIYFGAIQLGTTLTSLLLGWFGVSAIASLLVEALSKHFSEALWMVNTLSIIFGFIVISFLHSVFGGLVPKSIAIQRAETLAISMIWPLHIFCILGYPIITLFDKAVKEILKLFGLEETTEAKLTHSEKDLRMIINDSQRNGVLAQMEGELINNVFELVDRLAREVMVSRQDMTCLFVDNSFEENMRVVRETGHTRYPVCVEDKDHVIGMVHIRDLMNLEMCSIGDQDLRRVMREVLVVPESLSAVQLLQIMRRNRKHLVLIADEYGGTAGLVALEDVLEEIVGDIRNEHDAEEPEIQHYPDGSIEFDGRVLLDNVEKVLNVHLEKHKEATIGGYIFRLLGRRPETGDEVSLDGYIFTVLQVNGFRVVRVKTIMNVSSDNEFTSNSSI